LEKFGEWITAIVRVVNFTDFNCIISKVVVNDKWQFFRVAEESQHFAVVVEELFLAWHFATTESFLHVLLHFIIAGASDLNQ
jgi:hypothetical protein